MVGFNCRTGPILINTNPLGCELHCVKKVVFRFGISHHICFYNDGQLKNMQIDAV